MCAYRQCGFENDCLSSAFDTNWMSCTLVARKTVAGSRGSGWKRSASVLNEVVVAVCSSKVSRASAGVRTCSVRLR